MRIGVTSDWHIDAGMNKDIEDSVMQIIEIFQKNKVDIIAIPGDFFDRKSTAEGRNLLRKLMQGMADVAPVIGCYGNHDQPGDLNIFGHLQAKYSIHIFDSPHVFDPGPFGPCIFHILPWFTKATWQAANIGMTKEEGDVAVSKLALQYISNNVTLWKNREPDPKIKHILLSHLMINGALAQNHQPMIGEGITFGVQDLLPAGFFAGIFGHIHLNQAFSPTAELFFYPGSPAAMDYGETPEKFCCILDTDENGLIEWHKLDTIDRFTMDVNNETKWTSIAENQSRICGARVRILLKVNEGENASQAKEEMEKRLLDLGALEAKVEPQVQPKELVRSVEITKAETLEQKLEAYWVANNNRPNELTVAGMKEKLAVLENRSRA